MRILLLLALLGSQLLLAPVARAQCIALSDLLAIGADPTVQVSGKTVTDHVSFEWAFVPASATSKEANWTFTPSGSSTPTARMMVRPQRPGQDVLLKTTQASCVRDLRSELKARKLSAQPVTCPSCEAVRYQAPDYDVTLYSQMKGEFPFVVVVHQVPPTMPPAASGTSTTKNP